MVLFAEIGPDFWMGVVAGVFGTIVVGVVALNNLAKNAKSEATDEEKERERNTYWWNDGKKPDYDKEDE